MIIIKINIYFGAKLASHYSIDEKSYEQLFEPVDDNISETNLKYHIMLLGKYMSENKSKVKILTHHIFKNNNIDNEIIDI